MVSSGLQRLFYVAWTIIKLNLFFVAGSFMGVFVLGIGPAFQTINDMIMAYGIDYQAMTWKEFFQGWKRNFKRSNLFFWVFALLTFFIGYNLFLSVQITGLLWLIIDFLLVFVLLLLVECYIYLVIYETIYDVSATDLLKLAFISLFLSFGNFIKLLFGIVSILVLTWYFKGLIVFATFSLLLIFSGYATKENRDIVDRKLI